MRITRIALVVLVCFLASASSDSGVPYPEGYRQWVHVKSTLIGPQHERFATNGGLHHYYANAKAVEGLAAGKFPDGSVLIDDLLEMTDVAPGVSSEGKRRRVAVMRKDSTRYADTGGWGFEVFAGDRAEPTLKPEAKAACFTCHSKRKERDLVFSEYRK